MTKFEWDYKKDIINRKKHNISFKDAVLVFSDKMQL
ncbi:BrnT family toxin [Brachyspira aalborgi]|nr:BrnT family toxin [Brachyspira aalborgi]